MLGKQAGKTGLLSCGLFEETKQVVQYGTVVHSNTICTLFTGKCYKFHNLLHCEATFSDGRQCDIGGTIAIAAPWGKRFGSDVRWSLHVASS